MTATAGTALAQPSTVPTSEPPRQGLSHIDGQPIKVGEHNEYYYEFKRTNVSANPLGWMIGIYGVSVSHAVSEHIALKGDVTIYNIVDTDTSGIEFSAALPIYFRRAYQGAFLEPGLMMRSFSDDDEDYHSSSDPSVTFGPQVLFGWHWTWDSGLNVAAAAGVGRDLDDNDAEPFFNGYFRVGYAF